MCIGVLPACRSCEGVRSPEAGVTDSCGLPCGCWELNPGPLEVQSVLLPAEPSLQPCFVIFNYVWVCAHEGESPRKLQSSDPLELELQMAVRPQWVWEPNSGPLKSHNKCS